MRPCVVWIRPSAFVLRQTSLHPDRLRRLHLHRMPAILPSGRKGTRPLRRPDAILPWIPAADMMSVSIRPTRAKALTVPDVLRPRTAPLKAGGLRKTGLQKGQDRSVLKSLIDTAPDRNPALIHVEVMEGGHLMKKNSS